MENSRPATQAVLQLFADRGDSEYGGEAVTQREHALQSAALAEADGASSALIAAALLHDIGHLLHDLPADAPDRGIDDLHENSGAAWLQRHFGPAVAEPVKLHVAAKRYLCAVDAEYLGRLSPPSVQSLQLQGGAMSADEVRDFEQHPRFRDAVRLRHWDDTAKVAGLATPDLTHFVRHLDAAADNAEASA
jgi:phosphonate degradation associated HDIG domain protein